MLRECEGDANDGVGDEGVVVMSAGHMGGTRGSGFVSSTADILRHCGVWDERSWCSM